ncbi:MAG: ORF6C domain-containing protein [Chloroflexota bacterium]|nr:ORF6C domain-containing protein [Chloroflexota bacterium]
MSDPLPQRIVPFYGDEVVAVQDADGTILVLFARLCENLGIDRVSQVRRIQRHSVLHDGLVTIDVQTEGGQQVAQCLRLDLLPLWLSGLQARRVKAELQPKLVQYQREAATVLWQAFKPQLLITEAPLARSENQAIQQLQQIAEMGYAIARMAEQQIELQRQQTALTNRVDVAARVIRDMQGQLGNVEVRLGVLEDQIHPAAYITEAQATEVSNQVKALAELLTGTDRAKNHYQGIFAELYRRFGVASYKLIRQEQYAAVLAFLADWRTSVSTT